MRLFSFGAAVHFVHEILISLQPIKILCAPDANLRATFAAVKVIEIFHALESCDHNLWDIWKKKKIICFLHSKGEKQKILDRQSK
jgi:hypothetical protein